ncbi:hypothetical protein CPB83DRAFT_843756 [Crepidotus variabilis]|uniref:C3H1-type domain-containing protein n=1 Tax=Crepidotus variabilis TaxID=179855 RepID=A0A9P6ESP3_9AGAR|nr:hypothetical protein CPB83DRAFT_843756 [Crepidotus variabilis]
MATQPLGEASQQLWDETLARLLTLSSATVRRNADLENRVAELEVELLVWKQAHSVAIEASEREVKAHNVQIAALNRQISNTDSFKSNQHALILCIINGDELVFSPNLLAQGYSGGRTAAQQLTQRIAAQLSSEDVQVYGRLSFWTTIYFDRMELADDLAASKLCSHEQFHAFITGFTQASPRFSMVDTGRGKENLEAKIQEHLQTFTYFPQTLRVFFGGYEPATHMEVFTGLSRDEMLGKITLLHPNQHAADAVLDRLDVFPLPRLILDGLFLSEKLPRAPKKLAPLATGSYNSVTSNGGLISPQSPARSVGRPIDPSLPLHKQNPPPCNEHYLMTCSKGAGNCKYSHDYILTTEQLVSLANNAKKAPCNWLKNGVHCPYGEKCCWGHVCPNGPKCFHLSKGKCWFKGESMHPELLS